MNKSATSLLVYGSYLVVLGILFVVVPNPVIGLFGFPPASDVWIRVAGMLLIYLGTYDILAARTELTQFFRWSVYLLRVAAIRAANVAPIWRD